MVIEKINTKDIKITIPKKLNGFLLLKLFINEKPCLNLFILNKDLIKKSSKIEAGNTSKGLEEFRLKEGSSTSLHIIKIEIVKQIKLINSEVETVIIELCICILKKALK